MSETSEPGLRPNVGSPFPPTQWSLVLTAAQGNEAAARESLGRLCVVYREPIRAWLLRHGTSPDAADDQTQQFIEHLLSGNRLGRVERRETKFRTFLIECLRRMLRGEWRKEMAAKRGGGAGTEPLPEEIASPAPALDQLLDEDFALTVHRRALERLAHDCRNESQRQRLQALQRCIWGHDPHLSYAELGQHLAMTANHVKKAVFNLRQDYYDAFRGEILQTVTPEAVDEETRYLLALVAGGLERRAASPAAGPI